jgi:O-6-methylguanine DNA methyltransferase
MLTAKNKSCNNDMGADTMTRSKEDQHHATIATVATPFGKVIIAAGPKGIFMVGRGHVKVLKGSKKGRDDFQKKELTRAVKELREYYLRKRQRFTVQLDLSRGTQFQQKVWKELCKVPFGKTVTYAELTRRIKRPHGARAVGQAVGSNPIGIIIPCHRVIASGGKVGGWSGPGGIAGKLAMLRFEGVDGLKMNEKRKIKRKR